MAKQKVVLEQYSDSVSTKESAIRNFFMAWPLGQEVRRTTGILSLQFWTHSLKSLEQLEILRNDHSGKTKSPGFLLYIIADDQNKTKIK